MGRGTATPLGVVVEGYLAEEPLRQPKRAATSPSQVDGEDWSAENPLEDPVDLGEVVIEPEARL